MSEVAGDWRSNLELKARCADLEAAGRAAEKLGAVQSDVLHQVDTYFRVPHGRLKLRQIRSERDRAERAELIWYDRPNETAEKTCHYRVVPMVDGEGVLAALERAIGLRGVVTKTRRLLLWENVRIHLDSVQHLGTFIEYEAVLDGAAGNDREGSAGRLGKLREVMKVSAGDLVDRSYSDLMGI